MPASIYVDSDEGLGLVHNDVPPALEVDHAAEGALQLPADVETIENGLMIVIEFDLVGGALGDFANHVAHSLIRLLGIDHDSFHVFGEEITHRPFDQVRFLEDARWGRLVFNSVLDVLPFLQQ